jgi:long-chain fatty acid transport protein
VVPRVGVERTVVDRSTWGAAARAGYFLEPSPAPEQQGTGRLFDATRHAVTLGGGFELRGSVPLTFDVFTQGHLLAPRTHRIALDEAGTSRGQAKTSGFILVGGATATVRF